MLTNIDKHTHRSWDSDVIVNDGGKLDIVVKESDLETKPVVWLKLGRAIVRPARAWPMLSFAPSSVIGFRPCYLFEVVFSPRTIVVVILMRASDTLPSRTDDPRGRNES